MNENTNLCPGLWSWGLLSAKPQEALEKSEAANEVQTTTLSINLLGTRP